jgi:hypothetical protein
VERVIAVSFVLALGCVRTANYVMPVAPREPQDDYVPCETHCATLTDNVHYGRVMACQYAGYADGSERGRGVAVCRMETLTE